MAANTDCPVAREKMSVCPGSTAIEALATPLFPTPSAGAAMVGARAAGRVGGAP